MAATHFEGHKPLPRTETLQKMLDLERQYKLTRLQNTQTSPRPDSAMSFQPQIRPVPIQTRRRDSRESLYQQQQQQGDQVSNGVRRTGPVSPLSITIPSPVGSGDREQQPQTSQKIGVPTMAADNDERPAGTEDFDDATPREKSVTFLAESRDDHDDSDDDAVSDQSSICQSPSWEGYGQKKKDKKKKQEAEQRKKEKQRIEQELRSAAKKRATNRLYKLPPSESPDPNTFRDRPSSSSSTRLDSSSGHSTRSSKFTPSPHQALIPEVWGMAVGSGLNTLRPRPSYSRATSAVGSIPDQVSSRATTSPVPQPPQQISSSNKGLSNGVTISPTTERDSRGEGLASTNDKVYPPTSSRSHAVRNIIPASHSRHNSASTVTTVSAKTEEQSNLAKAHNLNSGEGLNLYSTSNLSDQALSCSTEPSVRGRQSAESASSSSYVRKARAQSIERSIKGFMQEAALSDPDLLNSSHRTKFSYLGPAQHHPQLNGHRPSSSQSRKAQPSGAVNGVNGLSIGTQDSSTVTLVSEKQDKQLQKQQQPVQPDKPQRSAPSFVPARAESTDKDGESNNDYFTFVTKPYSPPSLDLATPAGGIFSSIKSRISRRSSTSSGSASNTGRSFKERAMGAMHLQSTSGVTVSSQPPTRKPSQNSSLTTASALSNSQPEPVVHSLPIPHKDTRRLPKPARVLGEINQETMSQGAPARSRPSEGSSTSSYHDDSSVPPSPASTPDTSRPQSAKGLSATIEEIQIGSPNMFMSSHEDLTLTNPLLNGQVTAKDRNIPDLLDPSTSDVSQERATADSLNQTQRPASRTASVRDVTVDRPRSKGRLLDDLERPSSRGRLLENVERPGSRGRVLEEVKQPQQRGNRETTAAKVEPEAKDMEDIILNSVPNLSEGLGILDEAWSQTTVTPDADADAQSFVTTLTNQKSTASLKSQPGNIKEAAILAESQNTLGIHPALIGQYHATDLPISKHALQEVDEMLLSARDAAEQQQPPEKSQQRNSFRKKEKRNNQQAKHMSIVNEEPRQGDDTHEKFQRQHQRVSSPVPADGDPRKTSIDVSFLPPLRHEAFIPPKSKARNSTPPKTNAEDQEASATPASNEMAISPAPVPALAQAQILPSGRSSPSAMYLQEARRSAPMVSSPLSNAIRSAKVNLSTPSLARPGLKTAASFSNSNSQQQLHAKAHVPLPLPPPTSSSSAPGANQAKSPTSPKFRIPAHEPEQLGKPVSKPIAKMLVECCNCKFFHDMPSRVYECMAQPDAVVTDRDLGVSGAITTMVKCPWCSHNMSTQCCAGFAAVVYLKERLH